MTKTPLTQDPRVHALLYGACAPTPGRGLPDQMPAAAASVDILTLIARQLRDSRLRQGALGVLAIRIADVRSAYGQAPESLNPPLRQELARRLRNRVRADDSALWLGGEAYGVILAHCRPEAVALVSRRLHEALGGTYRVGARYLEVRVGVGGAGPSTPEATAQALWDAATRSRDAAPGR